MLRSPTITLVFVAAALAGCAADDSDVVDATPEWDAAAPDAVPDANEQAACMQLCECATTECSSEYPDMDLCMEECAGLMSRTVACRSLHCGYAQTDPTTHCPHVDGDENDPGTPEECIEQ